MNDKQLQQLYIQIQNEKNPKLKDYWKKVLQLELKNKKEGC